eukprot:TRINITY_DN5345_c0_g1_i1.p1 TRINITY_DN5345_c0_g1~~TRINITY_DN5345_c0_g1_i1.p1  ORF type:complete len:164 (-),score=65.45 TRINITY_DN5345_c0_g1_i1:18-509(-)
MDEQGLVHFFQHAKFLRVLDLRLFENLTSNLTRALSTCCPKMEVLHLGKSFNLNDESIFHLEKLFNLKTLNIDGLRAVTDEGLKFFPPNLKTLHMYWSPGISELGFSTCFQLENLETVSVLAEREKHDEGDFENLKNRFPHLEMVKLSGRGTEIRMKFIFPTK